MRIARLWLGLAALGLALSAGAEEDWKALRASGALGERYDGLLEARAERAAGVAESINASRRELYAKRAAESGTTVDQVGRIFFQENLAFLPAGTWLRMEDGSWTQK
jgi:uncharacterized protein YdbL (DUF1318 family)